MNKVQLVKALAVKFEVSARDADEILKTVVDTVVEGLRTDGTVTIPQIGKLKVRDVPTRSGVAMGKPWTKEAHKKVVLALSTEGRGLV